MSLVGFQGNGTWMLGRHDGRIMLCLRNEEVRLAK